MKIFIKIALTAAVVSICAQQVYRCVSRMVAKNILKDYSEALEQGEVISITIKKLS